MKYILKYLFVALVFVHRAIYLLVERLFKIIWNTISVLWNANKRGCMDMRKIHIIEGSWVVIVVFMVAACPATIVLLLNKESHCIDYYSSYADYFKRQNIQASKMFFVNFKK